MTVLTSERETEERRRQNSAYTWNTFDRSRSRHFYRPVCPTQYQTTDLSTSTTVQVSSSSKHCLVYIRLCASL